MCIYIESERERERARESERERERARESERERLYLFENNFLLSMYAQAHGLALPCYQCKTIGARERERQRERERERGNHSIYIVRNEMK